MGTLLRKVCKNLLFLYQGITIVFWLAIAVQMTAWAIGPNDVWYDTLTQASALLFHSVSRFVTVVYDAVTACLFCMYHWRYPWWQRLGRWMQG